MSGMHNSLYVECDQISTLDISRWQSSFLNLQTFLEEEGRLFLLSHEQASKLLGDLASKALGKGSLFLERHTHTKPPSQLCNLQAGGSPTSMVELPR
jgi:hypothetical protein